MSFSTDETLAIEKLAIREVNLIAAHAAANSQTIDDALSQYIELKRLCIHHAQQRIAKERGAAT